VRAAGICGADCFTVKAEKVRGGDVDYGFVGEVTGADPFLVDVLLGAGCIPVIACIAMGNDFNFYNINADSMASACAVAFKADRLLFLTDVNGVLDGNGGVIPELTPAAIDALVAGGAVTGGMLPKLGACKKAVENGVGEVGIVNGAVDGIIKKVLAGKNPGTTVHR
jgi:acetylglutamate kinase